MKCISLKSVTGGVFRMTLLALTVASLGTACNKSQSSPAGAPAELTDEVVFSAGGPAMNSAVSTKATVVDALPSFYAGCTTGAAGSEVSVWNSTTFTGSGAPMVYKGDKWWPITDPSYHFYASNAALTFAAGGTTVAASNATDVVCAYLPEPTYKVRNVLSFEHIFARLGQVTVSASASYAISNVSISITPRVSGTYNIRTGAGKTDGTGWSGTVDGSAAVIAARAAELARSGNFSQANDIYLVPGTYTISATWTATAPGYSETFSNKTQEISITAGKVNKITTTLGGRGTEIEFGVEIAAWDETTQDVDFMIDDAETPFTLDIITSGNLIWKSNDEEFCTNKLAYSSDNGLTWNEVAATNAGAQIHVNAGDKLLIKHGSGYWQCDDCYYSMLGVSNGATFYAYGNFASFDSNSTVLESAKLFYNNHGLYSHPKRNIVLPQTVYGWTYSMFEGCVNLSKLPVINVQTLSYNGNGTCINMFKGCSAVNEVYFLAAAGDAFIDFDNFNSAFSNMSSTGVLHVHTSLRTSVENAGWNMDDFKNAIGIPSAWTIDYVD